MADLALDDLSSKNLDGSVNVVVVVVVGVSVVLCCVVSLSLLLLSTSPTNLFHPSRRTQKLTHGR